MTHNLTIGFKFTSMQVLGMCGLILLESAVLFVMCVFLPAWVVSALIVAAEIVEFVALSRRAWFRILLERAILPGVRLVSEIRIDTSVPVQEINHSQANNRRLILFDWRHWTFLRGRTNEIQYYPFMAEIRHGLWLIVLFIPALLFRIFGNWLFLGLFVIEFQRPDPLFPLYWDIFPAVIVLTIPAFTVGVAGAILILFGTAQKMGRLTRYGQVLTGEMLSFSETNKGRHRQIALQYQFRTTQGQHIVSTLYLLKRPSGLRYRNPELGNRLKILYVDPECYKVL